MNNWVSSLPTNDVEWDQGYLGSLCYTKYKYAFHARHTIYKNFQMKDLDWKALFYTDPMLHHKGVWEYGYVRVYTT